MINARQSTEIVVVGVEAFGRFALGALDFGLLKFWSDGPNHTRGYTVLQLEDILKVAVKTIRPKMNAG